MRLLLILLLLSTWSSCKEAPKYMTIDRAAYRDKFEGFWLGQSIANWTGLVTEMDKTGNIGEIKTGDFYTRKDWGKPDQPNIWELDTPSKISSFLTENFRISIISTEPGKIFQMKGLTRLIRWQPQDLK